MHHDVPFCVLENVLVVLDVYCMIGLGDMAQTYYQYSDDNNKFDDITKYRKNAC